ncbi:beta-lactamase [Secundilactobacillus paracollinoides DSM 15502 = JCM 11969]|nr:beta-lactamase [Secundilactobacillus paracollinoides DSM 15502 = JCM 11969]
MVDNLILKMETNETNGGKIMQPRKQALKIGAVLLAVSTVGLIGWHLHQRHQTVITTSHQSLQPATKSGKQRQTASHKRRRVTQYLTRHHFVGSALVIKNNRVIYQQGIGWANARQSVPNDNQSEYQILSIQKSLTAAMVMKLVTAHRLRLNTTLSRFYPKIKNADHISIRSLLNMTSGLSLTHGSPSRLTAKQVVAYDADHLTSQPNQVGQWHYEPVNYVLLTGIIMRLTHRSYAQNFNTMFKGPIHLLHSGFVQQWGHTVFRTTSYHHISNRQIVPNYQRVYHESTVAMQNELGTGQVYMSTRDLFRVEQALLQGRLISKRAVAQLHQPGSVSTYGGGVYNQPDGIRLHGIGYGYESAALLTRNDRTGVVLLSNDYRRHASVLPLANTMFKKVAD